jgi:xylose isomerase
MGKLTYGAGIWAFGQFVDRYAGDGYGPTRTSQQMIEDAAKVPGLKHLDINVPFDIPERTAIEIKKMLDDNGLICRATTPHIYMREYVKGSFTNPDTKLRSQTKDRVREAIAAAEILGATYVKFWPGQDGFDFPLQANYLQIWDYTINGIRDLANENP